MKLIRLLLGSIFGWPFGLAVESVLLTCWPLYLYLWLGLGWRWYAALPALLLGWVGANLIGLATLPVPLRAKLNGILGAVFVREVRLHFPRWLWLYDNDEDGVAGPLEGRNGNERRWCERAKRWPLWLRVLSWQFRNPIANLRRSIWGVQLDGAQIEALGNCRRPEQDFGGVVPAWLWARKGWRVGFWLVRGSRRWNTITHAIGWRVFAFDARRDKPADAHQGFKVQPWRRG